VRARVCFADECVEARAIFDPRADEDQGLRGLDLALSASCRLFARAGIIVLSGVAERGQREEKSQTIGREGGDFHRGITKV
jgi:hypothetical protein